MSEKILHIAAFCFAALVIIIGCLILLENREIERQNIKALKQLQIRYDSIDIEAVRLRKLLRLRQAGIDSLTQLIKEDSIKLRTVKLQYHETVSRNDHKVDSIYTLSDTATVEYLSDWLKEE